MDRYSLKPVLYFKMSKNQVELDVKAPLLLYHFRSFANTTDI